MFLSYSPVLPGCDTKKRIWRFFLPPRLTANLLRSQVEGPGAVHEIGGCGGRGGDIERPISPESTSGRFSTTNL